MTFMMHDINRCTRDLFQGDILTLHPGHDAAPTLVFPSSKFDGQFSRQGVGLSLYITNLKSKPAKQVVLFGSKENTSK